MNDKTYTIQELITYFNEEMDKLPNDYRLTAMNFNRREIAVIIEALRHHLDSDDCK